MQWIMAAVLGTSTVPVPPQIRKIVLCSLPNITFAGRNVRDKIDAAHSSLAQENNLPG
jgi:hypothetical protein